MLTKPSSLWYFHEDIWKHDWSRDRLIVGSCLLLSRHKRGLSKSQLPQSPGFKVSFDALQRDALCLRHQRNREQKRQQTKTRVKPIRAVRMNRRLEILICWGMGREKEKIKLMGKMGELPGNNGSFFYLVAIFFWRFLPFYSGNLAKPWSLFVSLSLFLLLLPSWC